MKNSNQETNQESQNKSPNREKKKNKTTVNRTRANVLLLGANGCGEDEIIRLSASSLGVGVVWADCWLLKGDTSGSTEAKLRQIFLRASTQAPCVLALKNVHCIAKDRDGGEDARVVACVEDEIRNLASLGHPVLLVATAPHRMLVPGDLWSLFSHQEEVEAAGVGARRDMWAWVGCAGESHILAQRTAGYVYGDFMALLQASHRHRINRLMKSLDNDDANTDKGTDDELEYEDIISALDELQSSRSEALGAPRIPQVRWREVGGLEAAKREVVNTIQLPLKHPALVSSSMRRSGVLLFGPPGTGKTLLAKAVATECGLNFLSVKGPELLNMYVGQSEENVRQVFSKARAAAPCVIFFDELDSLAPNRGRSGDSGGVMDRIVSALLAELDGVATSADVFVLAATNRPDLIDPALLRPGRFEKLVFLGVCEDRAGQVKVLRAITAKMPLHDDVSLARVAECLPLTLTGADMHALCTDALYNALHHATTRINQGLVDSDSAEVVVNEQDFFSAARNLVPSVTPRELERYKALSASQR